MFWGDQCYGGHTGKAMQASRTQWYLAEGDAGFFDTYILLANPGDATANVDGRLTCWTTGARPVRRTYNVRGERARYTIYANAGARAARHARSRRSIDQRPADHRRARRCTSRHQGRFWAGGHEAAAVEAPATDWFVAEGRTGSLFDTFLLLANPNDAGGDGHRPLPAARRRPRS